MTKIFIEVTGTKTGTQSFETGYSCLDQANRWIDAYKDYPDFKELSFRAYAIED